MKTKISLKNIYSKDFFILTIIGFLPLIWKVLEIALLYNFENALKILGQIAFVGIIFKVFEETLINPLYKILNKSNFQIEQDKASIAKKFLLWYGLATIVFTIILFFTINPIIQVSKVPSYIFEETSAFLKLYVIASGLGIISKYLYTFSIINKDTKKLFVYLLIKAFATAVLFIIFVPSFSLGLGVKGIAIAEIVVNFATIIYLFFTFPKTTKSQNNIFDTKEYIKLSIISFCETLIRNVVYYFIILVLLNTIDEQELYFVSNEYIWSIMLVPVLAQSTIIKQDIANNKEYSLKPYFINCLILTAFMLVLLPLALVVFKHVYNLANYIDYLIVLLKLFPCYIIFIFDSVIEAYFIATGKLIHIFMQSLITNILVYLTAYILYLCNVWVVTLNSIILIFNIGVIFSSIYTITTFSILKSKQKLKTET